MLLAWSHPDGNGGDAEGSGDDGGDVMVVLTMMIVIGRLMLTSVMMRKITTESMI